MNRTSAEPTAETMADATTGATMTGATTAGAMTADAATTGATVPGAAAHGAGRAAAGARPGWVWALPGGPGCAGHARHVLRDALARLGVPPAAISDAQLMVSELATNAHQHAGDHGPHELWLYLGGADPPVADPAAADPAGADPAGADVGGAEPGGAEAGRADAGGAGPGGAEAGRAEAGRAEAGRAEAGGVEAGGVAGAGGSAEVRCAIFDAFAEAALPGYSWTSGDCGRGLSIVRELSGGRWGTRRTRSRLGPSVRGKAVWFAVPGATAVAALR